MRLFIAIRFSPAVGRRLCEAMESLGRQALSAGLTRPENLHLTLAFIGEYRDPEQVKRILASVPLPAFRLALSEKGNFGNILWAGVKGNQKLKTYVRDLRAALKNAGIPFEDDRFTPHITLIRKVSARSPYQVHLPKAEMEVKRASLMKSETKNGKVTYREV